MSRWHRVRERLARGGLIFFISLLCVGSVNAVRPTQPTTPEPTPAAVPGDSVDGPADVDVEITLIEIAGQTVAEVDFPPDEDTLLDDDRAASRLLDVAPDGVSVAIVPELADEGGTLVLTDADGAREVAVHGVIDAAFSPDGRWLAAIDAAGGLWQVDTSDATATLRSVGPYVAPIGAVGDADVLLQAASSVAAPYDARLVRIDLSTGAVAPLSAEDELVYGARRLADGSIVYVAHLRTGGTTVVSLAGGRRDLMRLGDEVVNPTIAPDGRAIAYEVVGDGVYLAAVDAPPRRLAAGKAPAFSPDGNALLVRTEGALAVIDRSGRRLASIDEATAGWVRCGGCLP